LRRNVNMQIFLEGCSPDYLDNVRVCVIDLTKSILESMKRIDSEFSKLKSRLKVRYLNSVTLDVKYKKFFVFNPTYMEEERIDNLFDEGLLPAAVPEDMEIPSSICEDVASVATVLRGDGKVSWSAILRDYEGGISSVVITPVSIESLERLFPRDKKFSLRNEHEA